MLCENCKLNEATFHIKKIVNGQKKEILLCKECSNNWEGMKPKNTFNMNNFLAGLLDIDIDKGFSYVDKREIACMKCGLTYTDFKKIGKFGCNNCYHEFKEEVTPLMDKIHGHHKHRGKVPKRSGGQINIKRKIDELKRELNKVINREEFEKAVKIRDEIKELEKELKNMD